MNLLYYIIPTFLILQCFIIFIISRSRKNKLGLSIEQIKHFNDYIVILEYHMQKAYDIIYKDKILVFSLEGLKPKETDIDHILKMFCNLTLKMIGPSIQQHLIMLYGNEETLLFNIIDFFNTKFEDDSIRESAINNITNNEKNTKG